MTNSKWVSTHNLRPPSLEGHYLLTCSPWLAQLAYLYNPGLPIWGWYHSQWIGISYNNQLSKGKKKGSYKLACWLVNLMEEFLHWSSLFSNDSILCQVGKTNQYSHILKLRVMWYDLCWLFQNTDQMGTEWASLESSVYQTTALTSLLKSEFNSLVQRQNCCWVHKTKS